MCRFFASHSGHDLSAARRALLTLLCALAGAPLAWAADGASAGILSAAQVDAAQGDQSAAGSDATDQNTPGQLQEVVVTARRRQENLVNVPATVTAFTQQQIQQAGIESPRDFIQLTPNVTFVETQNIGTAFVIARGIAQARNSEPSMAVVVDGVQQANPSQFDQDLFDIQEIQVLKGPQGGLYGRDAIGGAILITTQAPTSTPQYSVKLGVDNGPGGSVLGTASGPLPIGSNLKYIASLYYDNTNGYIENEYLHQSADPYIDTAGRFRMIWQPSDDLSVDMRTSFSQVETRAYYYNIVSDVNDVSLPVQVNNPGIDDRNMFDNSIKVDDNLGFATLTSVSAYDTLSEIDTGDAYDFLPIKQSFFYHLLGFDLNQAQYLTTWSVSEDLRLASPANQRITWTAGVYGIHTQRYISTGNMIDTGNGVYPVYYNPSTNPLNPQFSFLADSQNNGAWAAYGDLTAELTSQLELALQLRYDNDHREDTTDTPESYLAAVNIPGFPAGFTGEKRTVDFSATQPKVTLRYKPNQNVTMYADWGRGFRSGGFNQTGVGAVAASEGILGVSDIFKAEVADTWEAGIKGETVGHRLLFDLAGYYTTSHNPYFFVFLAINSTQNLGNIDEVTYKGIDFSATALLTDRLQLDLGYGYTDSDITHDADPTVIGNQAPDVSKYTINVGLQYRQPVLANGDNVLARVDYQRIGDTWWDPQNDTVRNPVDLVNARLGFEAGPWMISAWSKNLFNKLYNAEFSPGGFVFKALPRTYGLEGTYTF
ncbi:MAG TPA: TonB-dependent receptor [Steroidobacteraceae bacterium]|nr:TonB-dependent receptor [Steroidobacteraceae bacterium]